MAELFSSIANAAKSITQNTDIRQFTDKIQGMVMNLTPVEQCVWDATNEEPWGPTGPQMKEVCNYTYQYDQFFGVMNMLYKRMLEDNKNAWRRVYKSLVLLNYLIQHGSERVISSAKDNLFHIRALESFKYTDEKGKDQGINIRHRAKIVIDLLQDDDKLRAERKKAKGDSKEKYQGYTPDDIRMGRGGQHSANSDKWDDDFKKYDKRKYSWEKSGDDKR
ncbi:unnamed protein product, partial [Mesorhabditis belari]|uniref:ENTH domain-containing protein n=1 Tax=Mesorhabditis belari TaxID=2138241 RepID=A0AAF3F920_9BILA